MILVPCGTIVFDETNTPLADLVSPFSQFIAAKGGKGGKGNRYFGSSTNRSPRYAQHGLPGEEKKLTLELRLIAEVGLVGLPNAGKSTLLKALTHARPKIAAYPFTTLHPNLGVLKFIDKEIVIADIPGLIEGASKGVGLGHDFLRHIDRTTVLVHLVSLETSHTETIWQDYQTICKELELSPYPLHHKQKIVALTKMDLINESQLDEIVHFFQKKHVLIEPISAVSKKGIESLMFSIKNKCAHA